MSLLTPLIQELVDIEGVSTYGSVTSIRGLLITVKLNFKKASVGSICRVFVNEDDVRMGEIIGFDNEEALIMPFTTVVGIYPGARVNVDSTPPFISPHESWQGRVINALAQPMDNGPPLKQGAIKSSLYADPVQAYKRGRVKERINVGVRAINAFLTMCRGQRQGIFAGSGVGKSVLLSMLARNTDCDVCVIGLIGERGREVNEFIEETLGPEGLAKSVIVVATSDESPLMRKRAAYTAMTVADYFRDQGLSVLCLLDSVTRFAMAQREIGLSAGEPPTTKGYTPSVFAELPRILERAGPGARDENGHAGMTSAFFTVLVEGDDTNEPIADTVRGILDGHIILDRSLAERGHFPAINIGRSVSRMVPMCHKEDERQTVRRARQLLATYEDMADMIRIGAYKPGSNEDVDTAIAFYPALTAFLMQDWHHKTDIDHDFAQLQKIVDQTGSK